MIHLIAERNSYIDAVRLANRHEKWVKENMNTLFTIPRPDAYLLAVSEHSGRTVKIMIAGVEMPNALLVARSLADCMIKSRDWAHIHVCYIDDQGNAKTDQSFALDPAPG